MSRNHPNDPKHIEVRCRPSNVGFALIPLCTIFAIACVYPCYHPGGSTAAQGDIWLILLGAAFLVAAIGFLLYMTFSRILADRSGIYWLGFRGWRFVKWDEVTDYYQETLPKGTIATIIVTPIHKFVLSDESWTNMPALRRCVQERAKKARSTAWCKHTDRPPYIEC